MDYPCPNAGGKTRKTPRPYGVAKGLARQRREQIRNCIYGFVVAASVSPYNLKRRGTDFI